ncbi:hypothetical protein [Cytophaga aurantiaca]|uniref:hypothetical protein n=1 Tax=Cytophaga aurantiaca TaxID=29530 RepID=UPI0003823A05|nr:hypothetical protein [Cytophaga aurantiaca]
MTYSITRFCRIRRDSVQADSVRIKTNTTEDLQKVEFSELYKHVSMEYPKYFKMDAVSKYGIIAAEHLLRGIDLKAKYTETEIGIVLSNASGSLDTDAEFQKTIQNKVNFFPSPAIFVYTLSNIVMGEICIKHKIKGENMFFLSETIQSELLEGFVSDLFNKNSIRCAVVGWVEYSFGKPDVLLLLVENTEQKNINQIEFTSNQIESLYEL